MAQGKNGEEGEKEGQVTVIGRDLITLGVPLGAGGHVVGEGWEEGRVNGREDEGEISVFA